LAPLPVLLAPGRTMPTGIWCGLGDPAAPLAEGVGQEPATRADPVRDPLPEAGGCLHPLHESPV